MLTYADVSGVVEQRTWASVFGQCSVRSAVDPHERYAHEPDPNNDYNETGIIN